VRRSDELLRQQTSELSPAAAKAKHAIDRECQHPADVLKQSIQKDDAPLDLIRLCLVGYVARLRTEAKRGEPVPLIRKNPVGAVTLNYLWADTVRWLLVVLHGYDINRSLCHFLVAEGHEDLLEQWLAISVPATAAARDLDNYSRDLWRGNLLRSIVRVHCVLNPKGEADGSIELLLQLDGVKDDALHHVPGDSPQTPRPPICSLSLWPAIVKITSQITACWCPTSNAELYDHFVARREKNAKHKKKHPILDRFRLPLWRPTRPDAKLAISLLRRHVDQPFADVVDEVLPRKGSDAYKAFAEMIYRAQTVAKLQGLAEDAEWLKQKADELYGSRTSTPPNTTGSQVWREV